jgi:hypothetical protein
VSRAGILPKAIVAALVGTATGGAAGVWSLRQPAAKLNGSATAPAMTTHAVTRLSPTTALPARIESRIEPTSAHADAAVSLPNDDAQALQRARALARKPDVSALMALRDEVARRASERGAAGSSAVKGALAELDLRLNEARMLRLKLDAEELRKADSTRR